METWVVREVCANSEGDCRNETTCGRWKINWFATHLMVSFQYLGFIELIGYILAHTQSHIHILHWDIEIHWIQVSGSSYDKVLRCSDTDLGGWTDVRSIRVCDDRERMVWVFFFTFLIISATLSDLISTLFTVKTEKFCWTCHNSEP